MSAGGDWRRFLAFVAANVVALVAFVWFGLVPAYDFLQSQRAEIDNLHSRLVLERASLAHNAAMTAQLEAKLTDAASRFIHGDSANLTNADLLTRLRKIAQGRGVVFASFATLPARDWSGRQLAGARVEFSGPSRNVSDILADIETGNSFLFIEKAHFTAAKLDEADEMVSISLDVYGVVG